MPKLKATAGRPLSRVSDSPSRRAFSPHIGRELPSARTVSGPSAALRSRNALCFASKAALLSKTRSSTATQPALTVRPSAACAQPKVAIAHASPCSARRRAVDDSSAARIGPSDSVPAYPGEKTLLPQAIRELLCARPQQMVSVRESGISDPGARVDNRDSKFLTQSRKKHIHLLQCVGAMPRAKFLALGHEQQCHRQPFRGAPFHEIAERSAIRPAQGEVGQCWLVLLPGSAERLAKLFRSSAV